MSHHPHETTTLRALLREAGEHLAHQSPPPSVRDRVLAVPTTTGVAASSPRRRWRFMLPAFAACAVVVLAVHVWTLPPPVQPKSSPAFIALAGDEQLRAAAREGGRAWIVRTELPRERLAAMGLPYDPARAGDRVRTELLMDRAGAVLAVRVLQ